jgi:phage baseplate assembly protein W
MDAGSIFGRGISFPPRVGPDGRVVWSEGEQNVRESVRIILMTSLNQRVRLPEFGGGLESFLFEPNNTATQNLMAERIETVLKRWEPRIVTESVRVQPDPDDPQSSAIATIQYKLVATQARERLSLSVTLKS